MQSQNFPRPRFSRGQERADDGSSEHVAPNFARGQMKTKTLGPPQRANSRRAKNEYSITRNTTTRGDSAGDRRHIPVTRLDASSDR